MKYIVLSKSEDNSIRYVSNTSPLLWTNDKNKAKLFMSINEIKLDLYTHMESLEKMKKELKLDIEVDSIT